LMSRVFRDLAGIAASSAVGPTEYAGGPA
jgi:hypothetical protein